MRRWHVMGYRSDRITDNFYFGPIEAATAAEAIAKAKQRPAWRDERIREAYASEIVER